MTKIIFKIIDKIFRWYYKQQVLNQEKELKHCGNNIKLTTNVLVITPSNLSIGDNTLIADYTTIFATHGVSIGKNCLISSGCGISSINHAFTSPERTQSGYEKCAPVTIGDNVWMGMNVVVLPGISIGNNSIIGAGSVVTKNVPNNEIWVGNPARFVKTITIDTKI